MMASVTLTSCQEFWDDLFGVESTPSTPSTPSEPDEPKDDKVVTEATVEDLADITAALNDAKDKIEAAAKSGGEYEIAIKSEEGLETTTTDNTIEVPRVEDSNINLNFTNGVSTKQTLTIKAADAKSETPTEAVNKLTITMPESKGLNLELDMPETTVTLKAASGEVVYDEVVATTALNTLYIEKGVTVKNLQVNGGTVVVKDGGVAETYVYAPQNDGYMLYVYNDGIKLDVKSGGFRLARADEDFISIVQKENGDLYPFKNLKVIKGKTNYANIWFSNYNSLLEKMIIAEGVSIRTYDIHAKVVETEGSGAEIIMMSDRGGSFTENEKMVAEIRTSLSSVTEIKGVSFSIEPVTENAKEKLAEADSIVFAFTNIPDNVERCTFNFNRITFRNEVTGTIKKCTFKKPDCTNGEVSLSIPGKTNETSSYMFSFLDCNFGEDFNFEIFVMPGEVESDKDYTATIVFNNCKLGEKTLTSDLNFIESVYGYIAQANVRFEINGKTYQFVEGSLEEVQ